ncbi:hypothetical protein ACQEUU_08105 [Nonomuraea sp. CA-218870]|uniref:hypothetical protein n=1 Tax=Nonomuraea sp. CA-218870 TaxID=3239998 RepID=UPI003D8FB972
MRLAPARTSALWVFAAMASGAIAPASVLRSFQAEVDLAEHGWVVFTLAVILTVNHPRCRGSGGCSASARTA